MTGTQQAAPTAYTLTVDGDNVHIYRLPSLPEHPGKLESTVTPHGLVWLARTPHGDLLAENLRGGVAEALDLYRDRDRGPDDPAHIQWEWDQQHGTAPALPPEPDHPGEQPPA
jgi:hypothetical protein